MDSTPRIWILPAEYGHQAIVLPPVQPSPEQPGTLEQQLQIVELAAANPWGYTDFEDRYQAARRVILQHARRRASK